MKRCVALKITLLDKKKLESGDKGEMLHKKAQENEWKILEIFGQQKGIKPSHIIKLYARLS
jgi:hypothetical protein